MHDLVIRGGTLVDGSGARGFLPKNELSGAAVAALVK